MTCYKKSIDLMSLDFVEKNYFKNFMFFSCIGYAVFKLSTKGLGDLFQGFVVLGSLCYFIHYWSSCKRDFVFWLIPLSIVIPFLSWLNSLYVMPDIAREKPYLFEMTYSLFFIMASIWLRGDLRRILIFWGASIVGVFLVFFVSSPDFFQDVLDGFDGNRVDFSFVNANHGAALLGYATLLVFSFLLYFCFFFDNLNFKYRFFLFVGFFSFLILLVFLTAITQSRQVWLGIFLAVSFLIFYILFNSRVDAFKVILLLSVFSLFVLLLSSFSFFESRVNSESDLIESLLYFDISKIPYTSTGIRIHFLYESLPWIASNPILGLGYESKTLVISMSDSIPVAIREEFLHLHNGYLEILVNYGFLGLLIFIMSFYKIYCATQDSRYKILFSMVLFSFFSFYICINFFESFLAFESGRYIFNCAASGLYSYHINQLVKNDDNFNEK